MLSIGCAKVKILAEKLDGLETSGVIFKVIKKEGLTLKVDHNANDDKTAKALVKEIIKSIPELKNLYVNIQLLNESGKIQ